jgi:beta-lactamase class A
MTTPTPPNTPINVSANVNVQVQQSLSTDLKDLSRNDVGDYFKSLRLRHYVEQVINKNEQQKVTTDVSIIDLQTSQTIVGHNLDTEQFAASVNKVPIAQLVLTDLRAGKLHMDTKLTWAAEDVRAGAGVYDQPGAPMEATVQDLLFDMLNPSGNTAVRVFVNKALGGAATTNTRIKNELHLQHTYLQPLDATHFYLGNSTSRDASKGIQMLLSNQDTYGQFVKHALATNIYTDYGVRSQLAGNDYIVLANKVGILDDPDGNNRHDVGLIYNTKTHKSYAYAFMNTAFGLGYSTATAQAGTSLADMGGATLRYAGDKPVQAATLKPFGTKQLTPETKLKY